MSQKARGLLAAVGLTFLTACADIPEREAEQKEKHTPSQDKTGGLRTEKLDNGCIEVQGSESGGLKIEKQISCPTFKTDTPEP